MAITTYAELQTAIARWLARDDLTDYIPDFIKLFEATAARRLHVRRQQGTTYLFTDDGDVSLPTDYIGAIKVTLESSPRQELRAVSQSEMEALYPDTTTGSPRAYTIIGSTMRTRPVDDDTEIELVYTQKTPALVNELNWLFTNHPDLYLFGSLVEAEAFNKDAEKAALWKMRRDELFDEINKLDFNERARMTVAFIGATP